MPLGRGGDECLDPSSQCLAQRAGARPKRRAIATPGRNGMGELPNRLSPPPPRNRLNTPAQNRSIHADPVVHPEGSAGIEASIGMDSKSDDLASWCTPKSPKTPECPARTKELTPRKRPEPPSPRPKAESSSRCRCNPKGTQEPRPSE